MKLLKRLQSVKFWREQILEIKRLPRNWAFQLLVFTYILGFTFLLRAHAYHLTPSANHLDEMQFAWSGLYLIETGVPVSWSNFEYPSRALYYQGKIDYQGQPPEASVTLYKPWLEEPPLFSLIVGYFAHSYGAEKEQFVPSSYIRIPMLYFAALTSVMVFLVTRLVSGSWTGILAMLVYGTVPIFVISSRSAMSENFIAMLFMVMIYLFLKFLKGGRFLFILPVPFLIGLAGLAKPTGFLLLPLSLFVILSVNRRGTFELVKRLLYLIITITPFIMAFFAYGYYFDPEIFNRFLAIHSNRPIGFNSLTWFLISPSYDTQILKDGWFLFCLLASFFFIFLPPSGLKKFIPIFFIYAVIIVIFSGGEGDLLAWYRFPSYPLMAIMGAWGIQGLVKRADFSSSFLAAGLLLASRSLLVNPFRPNITPTDLRVLFSLLMSLPTLNYLFKKQLLISLNRYVIILIIAAGIYLNSVYIYNAFTISCENRVCPLVPPTGYSWVEIPFISSIITLPYLR